MYCAARVSLRDLTPFTLEFGKSHADELPEFRSYADCKRTSSSKRPYYADLRRPTTVYSRTSFKLLRGLKLRLERIFS